MSRLNLIAVAVLAGASLAGCDSDDDQAPPTLAPNPVQIVDAFFSDVSARVANAPEGDEAGAVEAIIVTAPEDIEPVPLG